MDCGPTCLKMVAQHYGKSFSIPKLRDLSFITREGVSMMGISYAAEAIGMHTQGIKATYEQLRDEATLPVIVHWGQNHFVVVYRIKKGRNGNDTVYVADPAHGLLKYSKEQFLNKWREDDSGKTKKGITLLIEPTPEFYQENPHEEKKLSFGYLLGYLRPYRKYILQLMLGLLTGSLISLIFPYLTQSIVDVGINNKDMSFVVLILVAQLILTFGQTANGLIRNWISLHVTTRVSISLIANFLAKLMRLPISFFDAKMIGDIMQRISDHNRIQSFLTKSLIEIIFAVVTLVLYSFVMASYSYNILGVFYLGSFLYIGWILIFLKKRRDLDYKRFTQSSENQNSIVQLITGMQEIKLNNAEKRKRWEWERIQAKLFKVSVGGLLLNQNQQLGSTFIDQTKNIFISFLSVQAVINGEMTIGMMVAIQYIIGQLNAPIQQFIGFTQATQDAKISLERLSEIHEKPDEEKPEQERLFEIPKDAPISIKNLTYQYEGPASEKVLNDVNIDIPANKITAIVGSSGSGKTTLIKLLLGFYEPVEGKISLGKHPLKRYSPSEWRKQCGVVMQDGFIFSDNILNNVSIIDEIPNRAKVDKAVHAANIKEFVDTLPLGYNTKIGNDGTGISSGQKQRLLIARAIYKDPSYIFLDEATNSLDAKNEKIIMENLNQFFKGRTVVIVAHRLSTVKNADQIIVLEKGKVMEKGTHEDLVDAKGTYFDLIKNQLELGN
jgi:ATP-binding cassette subfamily B protein